MRCVYTSATQYTADVQSRAIAAGDDRGEQVRGHALRKLHLPIQQACAGAQSAHTEQSIHPSASDEGGVGQRSTSRRLLIEVGLPVGLAGDGAGCVSGEESALSVAVKGAIGAKSHCADHWATCFEHKLCGTGRRGKHTK